MERFEIRHSGDAEWQAAESIVAKLREAGHESYIVGGAVRDMLLGRRPKDIDVATSATPDAVQSVFPGSGLVGAKFGVVLVKEEGAIFEVATFRKDGEYGDGRHPDSVEFCGAREDAFRRDFTINALLYDPVCGEVVDHVGGIVDLRSGIIRAVGNADQRFAEDHLRMLRAVRFAVRYGFEIETGTAHAICANVGSLKAISPERIAMELNSVFTGRNPGDAMHLMSDLGIMSILLPEVELMHGVEQPPDWHPEGDVFIHTAMAMNKLVAPSETLAWSVLLHDVGKPDTFKVDETGRIRFHDHAPVGASIAGRILRQLKMPNEMIEDVEEVIRIHNTLHYTKDMRKSTLRKIIGAKHFPHSIELNRVDSMSSAQITEGFVHMIDSIIAQNGMLKMPSPFVTGGDLIDMGYKPGPVFGRVLREVYDQQLDGSIVDRETALEALKNAMSNL
jgi:poly(A) polymerase